MIRVLEQVRSQELNGRKALIASLAGAAFTAVCAQIAFHLPGNPVPYTMQVFAVLVCGMLLGPRVAALSQIQYVTVGFLGAPVFAGFTGGPAALLGPRGGYLIGFIVAAYLVGLFLDRSDRSFRTACMAGMLGVGAIYICGASWLAVWLRLFQQNGVAWQSWLLGVAPFVGVDVVKVVLAAQLTNGRKLN